MIAFIDGIYKLIFSISLANITYKHNIVVISYTKALLLITGFSERV